MSKRFHSSEHAFRPTEKQGALGGFTLSNRARILAAILSLATLEGCATVGGLLGLGKTPQQKAEEAYSEGDIKGALSHLKDVDPNQLSDTEKSKVKEVSDGAEGVVDYYLGKAKVATSNRLIQRNDYRRAITYCREALALLPSGHASRKRVEAEILKIQSTLKELEKRYGETQVELDKALALPDLTVESIDQLYSLFSKAQALRIALRKEDGSLYEKAIGKARQLLSAGDIVWANDLCKIAQSVDFNEGEIVRSTQVGEKDMALFAMVKVRNDKAMANRKAEVERLTQLALAANGEKRMEEVRRLIEEVRKLETRDFKAANALASKVSGMGRSRQRAVAPKKPVAVVAAPMPVAPDPAPSVPPQEDPGDLEQVRLVLDNLVSQFRSHDKLEAVAGLEEALSEFSDSQNLPLLSKQRNAWDPDRKRMISELREKADRLFVDEDPEALKAYRNLLRLNPPDDLRRQAAERVKTLEGILGK